MTRQEALDTLSSSSAHDRLKAVRFLARNSNPSDLQALRDALRSETVFYVRTGLKLAIKRVSNSASPEVEATSEEFEIPPDVRNQIRNKITEEVTGTILHEIASPVGLIASAAAREFPDYEHSKTRKLLENLKRVFQAIAQLKSAAAVPKPEEFDLVELLAEIESEAVGSDPVEVSLHGAKPMLITSDCSLLRLAISNGIRNAVEAVTGTPGDEPHPIVVAWGATDVDYWVTVLDRGPGMVGPAESAFGIGKTTKKGHSGFGLTIARQAVETLGGACTLQPNKVGKMTLHVLIVEDDEDFVEELRETIGRLPGDGEIRIAGSRDQAYEMLKDGFLDLVILDLKLPTVSGALDADPEHGHAVFNRIRAVAPGTPIFVLTGSPAEDFIPELLSNQQQIDIWSEGQKTGTILFLKKFDIDKCPERLMPVAQAIECLSDVELDRGDVDLSLAEDRLIRIFAKKFQGVRCVVSGLGGGLSGARVIRLKITDSQGVQVHDAVAKLSTHTDVRREGDCYDNHVTRLAPAATPRKLATLEFGAHKLAGVFFGLADGFNESAFDVARNAPERSEAVIRNVEAAMAGWIEGVPETRRSIVQIRRRLLSDESLDEVRDTFGLDWIEEFENRDIQARWGCSHGDFHGCNVLVSPAGVALIDYGDVCDGPASLDPVTLELSLLFHPDAPDRANAWPSAVQARRWSDLDAYLEDCPFPQFVRECRDWALRAGAGAREVAASAYSYLVRQLKYADTDKDRALALLEGVRSLYDGST